jgi:hypothetical protein
MLQQIEMFSDTSREALASQTPDKLSRDHRTILDYVRSQGQHGATRAEIAAATKLLLATACGRVNELVKDKRLVDSGRRRKTTTGCKAAVLLTSEGT